MSTALPRSAPTAAGDVHGGPAGSPALGGVMFDVPDVLYDATLWRRWLFQLLGRLGANTNYAAFDLAWEAQLVDVHRGRREYAEALQSFLIGYGLSWGQVDEIEAAARIKRQNLELDVRPLPGVARVVGHLNRRGLPLVAWADVPHSAAKLAERLERLVPAARFAGILSSFELECVQPDAACYRAAIEHLGCEPCEVLYVGHDAAHLAGAANAGLRTAAVNHGSESQADYCLNRLEDLIAVIERLPVRDVPKSTIPNVATAPHEALVFPGATSS